MPEIIRHFNDNLADFGLSTATGNYIVPVDHFRVGNFSLGTLPLPVGEEGHFAGSGSEGGGVISEVCVHRRTVKRPQSALLRGSELRSGTSAPIHRTGTSVCADFASENCLDIGDIRAWIDEALQITPSQLDPWLQPNSLDYTE